MGRTYSCRFSTEESNDSSVDQSKRRSRGYVQNLRTKSICERRQNGWKCFGNLFYAFLAAQKQFSLAEFKVFVEQILADSNFAKKRPRTMDIDDFLQLMLAFNKADVHFA
jgi:hypothetical protein